MCHTSTAPTSGVGTRGALVTLPSVSVIVPAFDEERCIAETLDRLRAAGEVVTAQSGTPVQILVVDNASTDRTAAMARERGAMVIGEATHTIATVRNAGARAAEHDVLVFVDADTLVPTQLLLRIGQVMANSACLGGAVDHTYDAQRPVIRAYLRFWRMVGIWRLRAAAWTRGLRTCFIRDVQVATSARRFDTWPLWRTLVLTNPVVALACRRRRFPWAGWYDKPPR